MILETYTRVFVDAAALERTSAFYSSLLGGREVMRFDYPEKGLVVAEVSAPALSVLIVAGPSDRRQPFEATRLTVKVDALEPHIHELLLAGAAQLEPVQATPVGRKTRFRHADGLVVEYVDHDARLWPGDRQAPGETKADGHCQVLLVCGSLRQGSTNAAVLRTAQALAMPGIEAVTYDGMGRLPQFDPGLDDAALPPLPAALRRAVERADALLFCTPEYAGSLPGALKNMLDWCVGGTGLNDKPVAWINVSAHGGAAGAHDALRTVLGYTASNIVEDACRAVPVGRDKVGADGLIADAGIRGAIADTLARLAAGAMLPLPDQE